MTNDAELDALLTRSLPPVADDGFARRVLAEILAAERKRMWIETGAMVGAVAVLAALVPAAGVLNVLERASGQVATSLPVAAGCLVLLVTVSAMRAWAD